MLVQSGSSPFSAMSHRYNQRLTTSSGNMYEEVRYERKSGIVGQLCGSLCCSLFGLALFFASLVGTAHNERSTVCVARSLHAARKEHHAVGCDGTGEDADRPIFFSCAIEDKSFSKMTPRDFGADFLEGGFEVTAVKVRQRVEMLQCEERKETSERKGRNGVKEKTERFTYNTKWSEQPVNSERFKGWNNRDAGSAMESGCGADFRGNPDFALKSASLTSGVLSAGGRDLSRHLSSLSATVPLNVRPGSYSLPAGGGAGGAGRGPRSGAKRRIARDGQQYTRQEFSDYYGQERGLDMWDEAREGESGHSGQEARVQGNLVQTCASQIGCLKISYYRSDAAHVSHLAAFDSHEGETYAWTAPASFLCSTRGSSNQVDLFREGRMSAEELVSSAEDSNTTMTWLLRLLCMCLAAAGVGCFLQPLQTLANYVDQCLDWFQAIPLLGPLLDFLGDMVAGAVSMTIVIISFGVAVPCTMAVIAIFWMLMRPLVAIPLLVACYAIMRSTIRLMRAYSNEGHGKRGKKA